MRVLLLLPPMAPWAEALVDGTALTMLVAPVLYWSLFRPMVRHLVLRRQSEEALKQAMAQLETRVAERTSELTQANAALNEEVARRRSTEEALRVEKLYFEQLFSGSPLAIAVLDASDVVRRVNPALVPLFGYSSEEMIGKRMNDLIVPEESWDEGQDLTERVSRGERIVLETVHRNGSSPHWRSMLSTPISRRAGAPRTNGSGSSVNCAMPSTR